MLKRIWAITQKEFIATFRDRGTLAIILDLISGIARQRVTVLATTHYMDEAELCQRVGFISQGRLVALDSHYRLKQTQMRWRVLEINSPSPDQVMLTLKTAQQKRELLLDEVALYGAQIHAVVLAGEEYLQVIQRILDEACVPIISMEWIEPTLEDVFISAVNAPPEAGLLKPPSSAGIPSDTR